MWRRHWSAETGVFLAIWLVLMLFGRTSLFRDPGTFWHTVLGEHMLVCGEVIRSDPLSFTMAGRPFVADQWLAELAMAALYRLGEWDALLLATATLLAAVYAWVGHRFLRAGLHPLALGLLLAVVLLASSHQFHVRPLVASIALQGITFAMVVDVEARRRSLRQLVWLVPLTIVWANLHGGVLAGLGTIGLVFGGWSLAWALGKQSPIRTWRGVAALAVLLVLCGLATLVGPYGIDLPRAWGATLSIPLPSLIQEHRPVDLAEPFGWTVVLLGLGYLATLLGVWPKRPRVTWLVPLLWFALACQRVRNLPLFAVTAAVAWAEVLPYSRLAGWLRRREMFAPPEEGATVHQSPTLHAVDATASRGRRWQAAILPTLLVAVSLILQTARAPVPLIGHGWVRFDPSLWPVEMLPQLQQIDRTSADGAPIFNDLALGGFLIFHTPRLRVFVDDRCNLYGSEFLRAYDRARREDPAEIDRWQRQYGFRYALVEAGKPLDRYLSSSPRWALVQRTTAAALYDSARKTPLILDRDPPCRSGSLVSFLAGPAPHGSSIGRSPGQTGSSRLDSRASHEGSGPRRSL